MDQVSFPPAELATSFEPLCRPSLVAGQFVRERSLMETRQALLKVSVCIPTYNYADYLPFAIESVLHQSFTDFELIIQDDCSSDNTAEVVERYLSDRRLIFETNERNLGLAGNWNLCLSKARGQYIKFIFADDLLASPDCLAKMVSVLDRDRSVSLVSSARNIIDSQSRLVHVLSDFGRGSFTADGHKIISYCLLILTNFIGEPSGVMFRRADSWRGFSPKICPRSRCGILVPSSQKRKVRFY